MIFTLDMSSGLEDFSSLGSLQDILIDKLGSHHNYFMVLYVGLIKWKKKINLGSPKDYQLNIMVVLSKIRYM